MMNPLADLKYQPGRGFTIQNVRTVREVGLMILTNLTQAIGHR